MRTTHRPGRTRRLYLLAVPVLATLAVAACSGGGSSGAIGSGNTVKGQKTTGGTVTQAWNSATPDFIFPYPPATNSDGYNANLTQPLWPAVVYGGDGAKAAVNWDKSVAKSVSYGDNDTSITITLQDWKWSDGQPVTSRDFTFTYNLLKAGYQNWNNYQTGLFPADVKSVTATDAHTVVVKLTQSYNPDFYTEDVLPTIQILPQHAWDKTSASGSAGNYDETPSGAKAVYNFLQKEGGDEATFTTNPLWQVVDGPWTLSSFNTNGDYSYVPNKSYSGKDKPSLAKWVNQTFTGSAAIIDALRSGSSIQVSALPLNDIGQAKALEQEGYSIASVPIPGVAEIQPNLYNTAAGPLLRQLYIRQAIEYLINRTQIVKDIYHGYADPGNGPVPVTAYSALASPLEKSGGPYPYSPSKAIALLKAHGWTVNPGGVSVCANPALCGTGISKGQQLSFVLLYESGSTTVDEENAAIQSSEEQAGLKLNLKPTPFNTLVGEIGSCTAASHPASSCGWQLGEFGYDPYNLYPAGVGLFNTGGNGNYGGYSSATEDNLINQTEFGSSTSTFYQYEDYTAQQLPFLWLPLRNEVLVYKSSLAGVTPMNSADAGNNTQDWYYVKQSK
jgi:peptide/nickel transport system substrate-binding protein